MRGTTLLLVAFGAACGVRAQDQDLAAMGLEDLMKLQVTTASRQEQSFLKVPAAIYVVTGDDIRNANALTVPEMLRMVPGLTVEVVDGNKWSVSIRGFGSRYANKLQVLIDGRSVYTPLFSGVFWDTNLVSPEEIDRIEVIRGPGGALWGANAVNGIINIITLPAKETQGGQVTVGAGDYDALNGEIRYGGSAGDKGFFRTYARYLGFAALETGSGAKNFDGWSALHGAYRLDKELDEHSQLQVSARFDRASIHQNIPIQNYSAPFTSVTQESVPATNWSLQGTLSNRLSDSFSREITFSYTGLDRSSRELVARTAVFDFGYQARHTKDLSQTLIYGAGFRRYEDKVAQTNLISFVRERESKNVFSGYAHYERDLTPKTRLALGLTAEHNEYTGVELQPSASLLHAKSERETYWLAASRAVRTPSRADDSLNLSYNTQAGNPLPTQIVILGNPSFRSETLISLEAGARLRPNASLYFDLTAFWHSYDNLRNYEAGTPFVVMSPVPHAVMPYTISNNMSATTAGLELAGTYQASPRLRIDGNASLFSDRYRLNAGSTDPFGNTSSERQGFTPRFQAGLRASYSLTTNLVVNGSFQYLSKRPDANLRSLSRLDLGINYVCPEAEFSLYARNLFSGSKLQSDRFLYETLSASGPAFGVQAKFKF